MTDYYMRQLIRHDDDGNEINIGQPAANAISDAVDSIIDGCNYFFNVIDNTTGSMMQVAALGGPGYAIQLLPADEVVAARYSLSESLSRSETIAVAQMFVESGQLGVVPFCAIAWQDRQEARVALTAQPSGLPTEDDTDESAILSEVELAPQATLNKAISEYCGNKSYLLLVAAHAFAHGATIAGFGEVPPMVDRAIEGGYPCVISALQQIGCAVDSEFDEHTALCHALNQCRYEFADELVRCGADAERARGSPYFANWIKRAATNNVKNVIASGDTAQLAALLTLQKPGYASGELLAHAVASRQPTMLRLLLQHKGRLRLKAARYDNAWGMAMMAADPVYLSILFEFGVHQDDAAIAVYDDETLRSASPQALGYMFEIGHADGLREGLATIVHWGHRLSHKQLPMFPLSYFNDLPLSTYVRACGLLSSGGRQDMVDALLDDLNTVTLLNDLAVSGDVKLLDRLFKVGFNPLLFADIGPTHPMLARAIRDRCVGLREAVLSIGGD